MNTKGTMELPEGITAPLAQNVMTSMLGNFSFILSAVAGMGSNTPDGFEYVAAADSVSANTWTTSLALVVDISSASFSETAAGSGT
jgi:hypothetical protein